LENYFSLAIPIVATITATRGEKQIKITDSCDDKFGPAYSLIFFRFSRQSFSRPRYSAIPQQPEPRPAVAVMPGPDLPADDLIHCPGRTESNDYSNISIAADRLQK